MKQALEKSTMEEIKRKAVVVGAGGLGREVASVLVKYFSDHCEFLGFIDDGKQAGEEVNGFSVLGGKDWFDHQEGELDVFMGIGIPKIRESLVNYIRENYPKAFFPNLVHPLASFHNESTISLGMGNFIADGVIMTTNISLGDFNLVNLTSTLGHDASIGSFCSIMPGVNISGGASIKNRVYVGTGAKLIKATSLGDDCTVGAGAVVNLDIPSGETWAGVPAKPISREG